MPFELEGISMILPMFFFSLITEQYLIIKSGLQPFLENEIPGDSRSFTR